LLFLLAVEDCCWVFWRALRGWVSSTKFSPLHFFFFPIIRKKKVCHPYYEYNSSVNIIHFIDFMLSWELTVDGSSTFGSSHNVNESMLLTFLRTTFCPQLHGSQGSHGVSEHHISA
jgi:hypothetical protein